MLSQWRILGGGHPERLVGGWHDSSERDRRRRRAGAAHRENRRAGSQVAAASDRPRHRPAIVGRPPPRDTGVDASAWINATTPDSKRLVQTRAAAARHLTLETHVGEEGIDEPLSSSMADE